MPKHEAEDTPDCFYKSSDFSRVSKVFIKDSEVDNLETDKILLFS